MENKEMRREKREAYRAKFAKASNAVKKLEDELEDAPKDYVEFVDKLILHIFAAIRAHHKDCDRVSIVIDYDFYQDGGERSLMRAIRLQKKNGDYETLEDIPAEELA